MGYGLMVYTVQLEKIREVCGSGDEKLVRMIGGRFKGDLARADGEFSSEITAGAPRLLEAVRQLVMGEASDPRYAFQYAYAYKQLVEHFGKPLANGSFYPFRGDWLEQVDSALVGIGVSALRTTDLQFGRTPIPLPSPADFPGMGSASAEQVREAHAQMGQATPYTGGDDAIEDALLEVRGWLETATKRGEGLAGFYH